ncbi:zinc finger in N-recognin (UBR box) containing protein, partial [Sarcoptes scabiei]
MSIKGNNDGQINAESIGHFKLIREVVNWLSACEIRLFNSQPIDKSENVLLDPEVKFMIESCYQMISYLSDIFTALEYHLIFLKNRKEMPNEEDVVAKKDKKDAKFHPIYIDDECKLNQKINNNQSDDETEDETDDDLDNHLCTYTFTRKEFINQHWYHCHTCKMLNGVGVCTVCAKVCHRGHDVTYSKHGSFF